MRRFSISWAVAIICIIATGASFSEIHRLKGRISELQHHKFHDHAAVREFMIKAALAQVDHPIVVFGDSITEMAPLPRQLCGRPVINAGIGGMDSWEAAREAPRLFEDRPSLIVLAFGANDIGSRTVGSDYSDLVKAAKALSSRVVSISDTSAAAIKVTIKRVDEKARVPFVDPTIAAALKLPDGIHYTNAAYRIWLPALETAIDKACVAAEAAAD